MPDRADEFRKLAEDCIVLARAVSDPAARASLLTMAQRWYELAREPAVDLNALLQEFNERQMTEPPAEQQPSKKDEQE